MAVTSKALARGAFATSSATLYTVPSATTAVVTDIVISSAGTAGTFTLSLDGIAMANTVAIAANSIVTIDLKQVLTTTKIIAGNASATSITYHISGVEIS